MATIRRSYAIFRESLCRPRQRQRDHLAAAVRDGHDRRVPAGGVRRFCQRHARADRGQQAADVRRPDRVVFREVVHRPFLQRCRHSLREHAAARWRSDDCRRFARRDRACRTHRSLGADLGNGRMDPAHSRRAHEADRRARRQGPRRGLGDCSGDDLREPERHRLDQAIDESRREDLGRVARIGRRHRPFHDASRDGRVGPAGRLVLHLADGRAHRPWSDGRVLDRTVDHDAALSGIFRTALYMYATEGRNPAGFSPEFVEHAFAPKRAKAAALRTGWPPVSSIRSIGCKRRKGGVKCP